VSTAVAPAPTPPPATSPESEQPPIVVRPKRRVGKVLQLVIIMVIWIALWKLFFASGNLVEGGYKGVQTWLQNTTDSLSASQMTNPIFVHFFNPIAQWMLSAIDGIANVFDALGWTGITAIATAIALVVAGWRFALLALIGFLSFGILGLWDESMATLDIVLLSVALSLLIGIPLGVWAGLSPRFNSIVIPILDLMQIMPSFAYLPFVVVFFLIGPQAGAIATMIYSIPPAIRLTAAGIREVSKPTAEASRSLGATKWQLLKDVQLPLAKRTIVLGVNQTMMAALAMVTIAAFIDTPGLGQVVIKAIETLNVGQSLNASLALVVMAIVFDRVTTAASERSDASARADRIRSRTSRLIGYAIAAAIVVVGILLPALFPSLAKFPTSWDVSNSIITNTNTFSDYVQLHWHGFTAWINQVVTTWLIDPIQSLLVNSPVIVTIAALVAVSFVVGRRRPAIVALICLVGVVLLGVWPSSMITLAAVLIGALFTMILGVIFGVWLGRSRWVDRVLRPILDAAQVMPVFVYLVPCLALFGVGRFTGIIAAVVYAAPVVIKIVGEGIRGVPVNSVEAAEAAGSNTWQMITKVQLPMSRNMFMVALNQGIIFVLAMVVVSGLVGGGGLGYDVIRGFSHTDLAGLGLAAGFAIVLLGVMLDRVTQAAGRSERHRVEAL